MLSSIQLSSAAATIFDTFSATGSFKEESDNMYANILRKGLAKQIKHYPRVVLQANNAVAAKQRMQLQQSYSSDLNAKDKKGIALLPVPKLADTMERFLETCKPLLTPEELKETMVQAQSFAGKDGQACKLQCMLMEKAQKTENWLADWWINAAYLDYRNSLIGWSSPGTPFAFANICNEDEFIHYAASVVLGALAFKQKIDDGNLKLEMMGKFPLDMQQYHKVIGTCRVPGEKTDCLQYNPDSCHIVVACNNHFYRVDVYDADRKPISLKQLIKQLKCVWDNSKKAAPPVGMLTATQRDTWGKNFKELIKNDCNKACINHIQKSLFLVCLDKSVTELQDLDKLTIAGHQTIHGGGSNFNTANRWYDKTIQFVISCDGVNGITYEHSPAEGGPVTSMGDFIQDYIKVDCAADTSDAKLDQVPRTLKFQLNNTLCDAITAATTEVDKFIKDFDFKVMKFEKYGKEFIKTQKMSPDSYIQMALQYAYYRLHEKPAAHYESAAMRQFLHGRTETIRSCSCASVAFAKAMGDSQCDEATKVQKLRDAVDAHKDYAKAALSGCGIDRHLLGLKLLALENNMEPHKFYKSPGFIKSSSFLLSTSQVPTKFEGFMGYGPSEKHGYGICYNPRADDIIIAVSSFKSSGETSTKKMVESLEKCLEDMANLLCKHQKSNL